MRKPNINDIFLASRIAKKVGLKDAELNYKGEAEEVGAQLLFFLLENLGNAEDEICELLSGLFEVDKEEFKTMPIDEMLVKFKELEGLKVFFTSLSELMNLNSATSSLNAMASGA